MGVAWFSIYGKNDALEMWEAMESGELFIEADDDDEYIQMYIVKQPIISFLH